MKSPYMDYCLAPPAKGLVAWLETLIVTALVIGLGMWLRPSDPLFMQAAFPWPVVAPLLAGVRYGFAPGLLSAGLLVMTLFILRESGLQTYGQVEPSYIVGLMICGMLVGEVRDLWQQRLQRLQRANDYSRSRLDEFTCAHQMLRVSHDLLEQRVAGSDQSLRSALLGLREKLRFMPGEGDALSVLAEPILALLGQYGSLRVAGLYRVDEHRAQVLPDALASIGAMGSLDTRDGLITLCLNRGELITVCQELIDSAGQAQPYSLQACVPLIDADGHLMAILAIRQMPFFAFQERTLSLLALLAGHIADLLRGDRHTLQSVDADAHHFSRQLKRCQSDMQQHGLNACVFGLEMTRANERLVQLLGRHQRGLDVQLLLRNGRCNPLLLILLPLTDSAGARGYLTRIGVLLHEAFGPDSDLASLGVQLWVYNLEPAGDGAGLRAFLFEECDLNVQQVDV
jgi:hypothetical protein